VKNDGAASPPGILRIYVSDREGSFKAGGGLDPGHPYPDSLRICRIVLPLNTRWKVEKSKDASSGGSFEFPLRLFAELEFYGKRYPVRWACSEPLNEDGSITISETKGIELY
jgi:hypothetical protein